jgi:hypothetical protein
MDYKLAAIAEHYRRVRLADAERARLIARATRNTGSRSTMSRPRQLSDGIHSQRAHSIDHLRAIASLALRM